MVAPGYSMAEVVARQLIGETDAAFGSADTSTKLKLLGVDVGVFGSGNGELDVVYSDPAHGIYGKLALTDDASTLLGGILVGDVTAYPTLRASVGGELPGKLADVLGSGEIDGALPGTAQVCVPATTSARTMC